MKYLLTAIDVMRMTLAIPLYIVAMALGTFAAAFEYLADKIDVI